MFETSVDKMLPVALEGLTTNVMIADTKLNIVYINPAVRAFLQTAEKDIQRELPRFSVSGLMGENIDIFHKNPAHNRAMLDRLKDQHQATIRIANWSFDLFVRALHRNGKKIGYSVEWVDASTRLKIADFEDTIAALDRAQARIEFDTKGNILTANRTFLGVMGYTLEEIVGKHHSIFIEPAYRQSTEYAGFWDRLARGTTLEGEFTRVRKDGKFAYIQGNYLPIAGADGKVRKVIKFALDVSDRNEATKEIGGCLKALAEGDLTRRVRGALTPALVQIGQDIDAMAESLQGTMRVIVEKAESMNAGSAAISQAADALSKRTEQQAANVEESAAALSVVTTSVKHSASMAADANKVVLEAKVESERSGHIVANAVGAMGEIASSAKQISQIIGVIDEIAFQTNLLALNAGVEAARAGDAGRGFAVVASEVRALAQRSAEAAKEIKGLIMTSAEQVEKGVHLVGEAGQALQTISRQVIGISTSMEQIAEGAREQAVSLSEVNTAVGQMDAAVQQNAAMVEESTAANLSLSQDAHALFEMAAKFEIGSRENRRQREAAPRAVSSTAITRTGSGRHGNLALKQEPEEWAEF